MRKSVAAIALTSAALIGCGRSHAEEPGPTVSRAFQVGNFTELEAAGPFDVTVRTGANPGVQVQGNKSLVDKLKVDVDGDKLRIRPERSHSWFSGWHGVRGKATVLVTVPQLRAATLAGAGAIRIDKIQGEDFEGSIAGAGDLILQSVNVRNLKVGIAGSGSLTGNGKVQSAIYDIAGSGDVKGEGIAAEELKVSIAGAGSVRAHATRAAKVDIMGAGDVEVTGGAKCEVHKMGSGDVRCS
jgi:hypothetical protein